MLIAYLLIACLFSITRATGDETVAKAVLGTIKTSVVKTNEAINL